MADLRGPSVLRTNFFQFHTVFLENLDGWRLLLRRILDPPLETQTHHYETLISLTLYPVVSLFPIWSRNYSMYHYPETLKQSKILNITPPVTMETNCWTMIAKTIEFIAMETEALFRLTFNYWAIKQEIRRRLWDSSVIKPVALSTCHVVWQMNDSNFLLVKTGHFTHGRPLTHASFSQLTQSWQYCKCWHTIFLQQQNSYLLWRLTWWSLVQEFNALLSELTWYVLVKGFSY